MKSILFNKIDLTKTGGFRIIAASIRVSDQTAGLMERDNKMKMSNLVKLAASGALAIALGASTAFALSAELSPEVLNGIEQDAAVGRFMHDKLGLSTKPSLSELNSAIGKLNPVQAAAVSSLLSSYASNRGADAKRNLTVFNALVTAQKDALDSINKVAVANVSQGKGVGAPTAQGQTCSREELAQKLSEGTRFSPAETLAALSFWAGRLTVGTCHADAGGAVSYIASARENLIASAIEGMNALRGMRDYSEDTARATWKTALAKSLGKSEAQASVVEDSLENNCQILNLKGAANHAVN